MFEVAEVVLVAKKKMILLLKNNALVLKILIYHRLCKVLGIFFA